MNHSKYSLAILELHNSDIHGINIHNPDSSWYHVTAIFKYNNIYGQETLEFWREQFETYTDLFCSFADGIIYDGNFGNYRINHPTIRNYKTLFYNYQNMNYSPIFTWAIAEIIETNDGVLFGIDKTVYLKLFQRKFLNYLRKRNSQFKKMANPKFLMRRECGKKS